MAKVTLNPILESFRGKVGDLVFKRSLEGTIVGRTPDRSGREATPTQIAQRERFSLAVLYGRSVVSDPAKKTIYQTAAKARGQRVFALTVADFLHAPVVEEIDLSGYTGQANEKIRI